MFVLKRERAKWKDVMGFHIRTCKTPAWKPIAFFHINQFTGGNYWVINDMSGLFAVIVLSVLTGMSHMMVRLLSLLCITVSGACWYHLSVILRSWPLQILQWRYAAALLCLVMYSVLAKTSHPDTIWSTVSSCCEHILHLLSTCWPQLLSESFWCLLLDLELPQVVPLFLLSDCLTTICWWWLCLRGASLGSWDIGHAKLWLSTFLLSLISS